MEMVVRGHLPERADVLGAEAQDTEMVVTEVTGGEYIYPGYGQLADIVQSRR